MASSILLEIGCLDRSFIGQLVLVGGDDVEFSQLRVDSDLSQTVAHFDVSDEANGFVT